MVRRAMRYLYLGSALSSRSQRRFPTRPYFSAYTSNPIPFENLAS